jgi:hypothetical protein
MSAWHTIEQLRDLFRQSSAYLFCYFLDHPVFVRTATREQ